MKAWMRNLIVTFTSSSKKLTVTYGNEETDNLDIDVHGYKYLSTLKDNCTITIKNLTYSQIVQLIYNKFDTVKVKAGYKSGNTMTMFDGYIMYISNKMIDKANNEVIIICTSKLLGLYGNRLMNLSLNSGINMYSALEFICKMGGIKNANISKEFKARLLTDALNCNGNSASIIDRLVNQNSTLVVQSDSTNGSILTIWDAYREDKRVINLRGDNILLSQGYPTLDSNGLTINVLPTFNFMPGDVIQLDNAIIDMSMSSKDEVLNTPNIGAYLDTNGEYMIYEISYQLQNRGHSFYLRMLCKRRDLMKGLIGNAK